jgi:alkylhydroperoxidase family enzyme
MQSWLDFGMPILRGSREDRQTELVKLRASQINGSAFLPSYALHGCPKLGETEECLYLLDAWRESPLYSRHERAGLG